MAPNGGQACRNCAPPRHQATLGCRTLLDADGLWTGAQPYDPPMNRDAGDSDLAAIRAQVLVPVKAFHRAKQRLADHVAPEIRSRLARTMADSVLRAAAPLDVVVVCDDEDVRLWALDAGADVCWTPGRDLNAALTAAVDQAAGSGVERVVIAHADLPFATDLARFADGGLEGVFIVPDRHGEGTNVMSLPTAPRFALSYGPGSRALHSQAAGDAGLTVIEVVDAALGWDIDEPMDLTPPDNLGELPLVFEACGRGAGN